MTDKFQNKYRIPSTRLQNWDYRWAASYFITICTQNRVHYFGEIADGKMVLSPAGVLADVSWYEIKNHSKNVDLGEFVIMPNHIHGILILTGDDYDNAFASVSASASVETGHALSLQSKNQSENIPESVQKTIGQQRFQNIGKNSISSIVGSYKSTVTKHTHRLGFDFQWQSRFYDHIIRNDESFQKISNYIINNPANWQEDKFFKE
jgi:REP element-mobilizing transposase RayT